MRAIPFLLSLLIACTVLAQTSNQPPIFNIDSIVTVWKQAILDKPFPPFTAKASKKTFSNDALKDKVVLINFWFETCLSCMKEMPALNTLYQKLKDNENVLFISFTFDDEEAIKRVKKKYGIAFSVFSTSAEECTRLMAVKSGYPTTMILDKRGVVQYLHGGWYDYANEKNPNDVILTTMLSEIQSLL